MTFDLIIRSKAGHDLEDIESYYKSISEQLSSRFFTEFYKVINYIKQEPELYQVKYKDVRIALLYRFPYGIHYKIQSDTIIIYRVLHTSRYFQ